jgi:alpha 1,6-mannosyltransferase
MEPQAEHGYQSPPDPVDDPLESLAKKYEEVRTHWLSSYDQSSAEELIRTPSGALDPDFNTYISRLESFVETYFLGSASYDPLIEVLSRLVRAQAPPFEARDFEKVIWSFDEGGESGTPGEFELWRERWPDWEVRVGDDALVDRWFQKSVVGMGEGEGQRSGEAAWKELWDGIRRPVMKADLLRFVQLGGTC